jgi:hypothetical protein
MPLPDFFAFLDESLAGIRTDEPEVHCALTQSLGRLRARLVSDGVAVVVWLDSNSWRMDPGDREADIEVAFNRQTILDLIDGCLTLEEAILREQLLIFGSVDKVETFNDAFLIYIEGLIRMPGTAALVRRYRQQ